MTETTDTRVFLDVCEDGTVTIRKVGEPRHRGAALPTRPTPWRMPSRSGLLACKLAYDESYILPEFKSHKARVTPPSGEA
jgi:hypothetical protein